MSEVLSHEIEATPLPVIARGGKKPDTDCRPTRTPSSVLLLTVMFLIEVPVFWSAWIPGPTLLLICTPLKSE